MKIDWSKAPEWANSICRHIGGSRAAVGDKGYNFDFHRKEAPQLPFKDQYCPRNFFVIENRPARDPACEHSESNRLGFPECGAEFSQPKYQSPIRAEVTPPAWTGEGLPPVGAMVEISRKGFGIRKGSEDFLGLPVRVAATFTTADSGVAMIAVDGGTSLGCEVFRADMAIPIRTAEQIAAEEREAACKQICIDAGSPEGTRGQMETAYRLYDAGYRKQATP
jgi:hypothetical protein